MPGFGITAGGMGERRRHVCVEFLEVADRRSRLAMEKIEKTDHAV